MPICLPAPPPWWKCPRYRYEEYSFIEVPNEQVQEVIDTWVIFRNSVNFTEKSGISLSAV